MGATTFYTRATGKTVTGAFEAARWAQEEDGKGGYSGTIAEKHDFVLLDAGAEGPALATSLERAAAGGRMDATWCAAQIGKTRGGDVQAMAEALIELADPRVDEKWGPAGCFAAGANQWLFFGWAST